MDPATGAVFADTVSGSNIKMFNGATCKAARTLGCGQAPTDDADRGLARQSSGARCNQHCPRTGQRRWHYLAFVAGIDEVTGIVNILSD